MIDSRSPAIDTTHDLEATTPPRLDGVPVIGSSLSIMRDALAFTEAARERGDVVAYEAFGADMAAVFDPDVVEQVLVSRSNEFWKGELDREFGDRIAHDGVVFTEGERWRRQRTVLQSWFTPDRIEAYADCMVAEAATLAHGWDDGDIVDVGDPLSAFTLRVLTKTLFDLEFDDERAATVRRATRALSTYASPRGFALRTLLPSWIPTPAEPAYERAMDDLDALVSRLVTQRREADADGEDLLSLLASVEYPDGTRMDPETVRDQLVTLLVAGHETSATALTFACWCLAGDDAVRTRLERELEAVCGDRDPTIVDLPDLEYTDAIVNETLRLYPPVTDLYREAGETTTLGGYRIPAGTTLQLSAYGIHRDERWWDAPETFRPGRWLEDRDRPEYAYFPFGGGPRHCLGMRFATVELKLALATLARRLEFERVTESLSPAAGLTLDPGTVELRINKR
ncbi:cytochrome P450 [Natronorubrum thiooxidans]|uniref:Cytochrome P450 n=1 Tax=Natronorubrum thiooxidans TaxID=308853 RepID=A0A1N7C067_9EURY|nr:cytochrome P450 [Natronorubrum thiooxidans]SIR56986.1 Cytochrome P450 [Natronorubrum thiooxidans]